VACGIPLGVIVANEKAAAAIKPGMHGSTFGGGPLACRVALEFLDVLDELLPAIRRVGGYFMKLNELARKHSFVKEVRGFGLMLGVELTIPGKQIVLDAMAEPACSSTARMTPCCVSCRPTSRPKRKSTRQSRFSESCSLRRNAGGLCRRCSGFQKRP
jgi:acetylornithine/succinyldiaminopimelate/putrescine aminotransferase